MKTYEFQANCKTEQRAIEAVKDFLRGLREIPEKFEFVVKKISCYNFKVIAKRKDVQWVV